ncbi:hypothetical protein ACERIT_08335 [Halopenitus sp. H-Gu1]|uniref:hypothetical protein n=1 Tax=Halopenitus sp. H-Gu1 TaxID=3242697 RepID=UPI00359D1151
MNTDTLSAVLRVCETTHVTIELPSETPDSTVVVRAGNLTVRFLPFTAAHPLLFTDDSSPESESRATTTVPQRALTRSITAADFVGDEIQLNVDPPRNYVVFSAAGKGSDDEVRYELPDSRIHTTSGREATFTMQIPRLKHLHPYLPPEKPATLSIKHDYLVLEATPIDTGTLTLYISFCTDPLR